MLSIAIETGSYSVKFLHFHNDRKSFHLLKTDEIVIEEKDPDELWSTQFNIINDYLSKIPNETLVYVYVPGQIIGHRMIQLPIKSKKKALQMLPFQIEEDLPSSLSQNHWAESLEQQGNECAATVGVIKRLTFQEYFSHFIEREIIPSMLTSDVSALEVFINQNREHFPDNFCVLNIGHESTRSFYFKNKKLISSNHSYIAGKAITEAISQNYSISYDEATLYKHQNSFCLIDEQYEHVNENQKEFAKMMDSTLAPLVSEIKRWDIGFRVEHGEQVKHFYICGGTANIKNINNYLAAKLNVHIESFNPYQFTKNENIDHDERLRNKFSQAAVLVYASGFKSKLLNFLKGDFTVNNGSDIPVIGASLIASRCLILAVAVSLFFVGKIFILNSKIKDAKRVEAALFKNPNLIEIIDKRTIRRASLQPQIIVNKLNDQNKAIQQTVKVIQSSLRTNALSPLNEVISLISIDDTEITKLVVNEYGDIDLSLKASKVESLKSIQDNFKGLDKKRWFTDLNQAQKILMITGKGK